MYNLLNTVLNSYGIILFGQRFLLFITVFLGDKVTGKIISPSNFPLNCHIFCISFVLLHDATLSAKSVILNILCCYSLRSRQRNECPRIENLFILRRKPVSLEHHRSRQTRHSSAQQHHISKELWILYHKKMVMPPKAEIITSHRSKVIFAQ